MNCKTVVKNAPICGKKINHNKNNERKIKNSAHVLLHCTVNALHCALFFCAFHATYVVYLGMAYSSNIIIILDTAKGSFVMHGKIYFCAPGTHGNATVKVPPFIICHSTHYYLNSGSPPSSAP